MGSKRTVHVFLQYYLPHVSGLTNVAAEIAEYLASHGFEVHVHCVGEQTHIQKINGVTAHYYKETFSFGRAKFSWQFLKSIFDLRKKQNVSVHAHLPLPESFLISLFLHKSAKVVTTYQCDAPRGSLMQNGISLLLDWSHSMLIKRSDFVCCTSEDYANNSRLNKVILQNNPIFIPATSKDRQKGNNSFAVKDKLLIGFIGRPTQEKGINVLLHAMKILPEEVVLLFAGPTEGLSDNVEIDDVLFSELMNQNRIITLGFLDDDQVNNFYHSIDVFAFPSINSFEAFGIVQVEAISASVPVVASSLPGVRTVVEATRFGEISKTNDATSLAKEISYALSNKYDKPHARLVLESKYLYPVPHDAYLHLFEILNE